VFQPTVSVVVPVFNRARVLPKCIDSLLRSDYPKARWELVCVDNGSTDGSMAVLRSYGERVRVLEEKRRGAAAARNTGVHAATGEVIAFTDSDCVVDPRWITEVVQPLADRTIAAVGGRILAHQPANSVSRFGEIIHDHSIAINYDKPPYFITMNLALRRDLLLRSGLFDVRLLRGQDSELAYRIGRDMPDKRFHYAHAAVIRHRNRSSLPSLMREGFVHGYHAVAVRRLHGDFIRSAQTHEDRSQWNIARTAAPHIAAWQRHVYSFAFRQSKNIGAWMARWRAAEATP